MRVVNCSTIRYWQIFFVKKVHLAAAQNGMPYYRAVLPERDTNLIHKAFSHTPFLGEQLMGSLTQRLACPCRQTQYDGL